MSLETMQNDLLIQKEELVNLTRVDGSILVSDVLCMVAKKLKDSGYKFEKNNENFNTIKVN